MRHNLIEQMINRAHAMHAATNTGIAQTTYHHYVWRFIAVGSPSLQQPRVLLDATMLPANYFKGWSTP